MEDDLIRRGDAVTVLCDACGNAACPKGLIPSCSYGDRMRNLPAVDAVEVVHSNWGKDPTVAECMNCGAIFPAFLRFHEWCPNCGARMDGRREDGDA